MRTHDELTVPRWLPFGLTAEEFDQAPADAQEAMRAFGETIAARHGDPEAQAAHDRRLAKQLGEHQEWMLEAGYSPENAKNEIRALAAGGLYRLREQRRRLLDRCRPLTLPARRRTVAGGRRRRSPRRRTCASRAGPDGELADPDDAPPHGGGAW